MEYGETHPNTAIGSAMDTVSDPKIIIALDYPDADSAVRMAEQLDPRMCRLKVGKELFTRSGPAVIERLNKLGYSIFLDLKFHDIPNTVASACRAAASLDIWMLNVHALGGPRMMNAAQEALAGISKRPYLIAVTVLTSMNAEDLSAVGLHGTAEDNVLRLATLAKNSDLDGVVCSPRETTVLRDIVGNDFLLVTPGIRPAGSDTQDQVRITTPEQAMAGGSNYLVIGRPITGSLEPRATLETINSTIGYNL